ESDQRAGVDDFVGRQRALGQVAFAASLGDLRADPDVRGIQGAQVDGDAGYGMSQRYSHAVVRNDELAGYFFTVDEHAVAAGDLGNPVAIAEVHHDMPARDPGIVGQTDVGLPRCVRVGIR